MGINQKQKHIIEIKKQKQIKKLPKVVNIKFNKNLLKKCNKQM